MNIMMHWRLSHIIRKAIESELDIKIDAYSFTRGNVKHDILPTLVKVPHYKNDSMDFVQAQINGLSALSLINPRKISKLLSERLGVITHYLSDFSCYAHTDLFPGDNRSHFLYEWQLFHQFEKNHKNIMGYCKAKTSNPLSSAEDIACYLEETYARYLDDIMDCDIYEWDTRTAIEVCVQVCLSIISICISNELKIAV